MALGRYTFLVSDLLTGNIISNVEISACHWSDVRVNSGSAQFTARLEHPTTNLTNFKPWCNAIWIVKDNVIKWGGIIGNAQRRGSTGVIQVPAMGFYEYYKARLLRSDAGMTYGSIQRVTDIEWTAVDPFRIFKDLIDHANSFTDGNINVGVVWSALVGTNIRQVFPTFAVKRIGDVIDQLVGRDDTGFDFYQEYSWSSNKPHCDFRLVYPAFTAAASIDLLFAPEYSTTATDSGGFSFAYKKPIARKSNIIDYDNDGTDPPITGIMIIGQGEGNSQASVYVQQTLGSVPLWEDTYPVKDIVDTAQLTAIGNLQLGLNGADNSTYTVKIDPMLPPFIDDIRPGLLINMTINHAFTQTTGTFVIDRKDVRLSKEGQELIELQLFPVNGL